MKDPFQDVDAMGDEFMEITAAALEYRATDAEVRPIIDEYLDYLEWSHSSLHIEVGAGTGAISRIMANMAKSGTVIGVDPSEGLIQRARALDENQAANLDFEVGDGRHLRFDSGSVQNVVMHTLLSHVEEPGKMLEEAHRVLSSGGRLAMYDADFEKARLGNFDGDPLNSCTDYFIRNFVANPFLISNVRELAREAGFKIEKFLIRTRAVTDSDVGLAYIRFSTSQMVKKGEISKSLATCLEEEYIRRKEAGTLYGLQPIGILIGRKET